LRISSFYNAELANDFPLGAEGALISVYSGCIIDLSSGDCCLKKRNTPEIVG